MLEIRNAPPLEDSERTTVWAGDPAVNQERSDLGRWAETGDPDALVIHEGRTPSLITWRPLDEDEIASLPSVRDYGIAIHLRAATRVGLLSIEGYDLGRGSVPRAGLVLVPMEKVRALSQLRATIPYGRAYHRWALAELGRSDDATRDEVGEVSLPRWLGALILAESFPRGG